MFVAGIANINCRAVAVSLNKSGPFALRRSIMGDTELWNVLEHAFLK